MQEFDYDLHKGKFSAKDPDKASQAALITVLCFATFWLLLTIGGVITLCILLKPYVMPTVSTFVGAAGVGGALTLGKKAFNLFKQLRGKGP